MYRWIFILFLAFSIQSAFAEERDLAQSELDDKKTAPELPPVVVEDSAVSSVQTPERNLSEEQAREQIYRTPGGVGVVGSDEISESRAYTDKDVLDFIPGVLIRPRYDSEESQISIRGSGLRNNFHLRGVNILIDGFAVNNADGFGQFGLLELLSAKRIEVYKGANALRLGANTLGGAINLVTKTGYDADLLELRGQAGSYGFFKGYVATGQNYGPFDLYAGGSDTELDNFRDHAEQTRRRIFSSFGYAFDGGATLRLDLGYVKNDETLPGSLTREQFEADPRQAAPESLEFDERHDYDYYRGAFTVRAPISSEQALEFNAQFNFLDLDHPLSFAVLTGDTQNLSGEIRYLLSAPVFGRGNLLTAGIQAAYTDQEDVRFVALGGGDRGDLSRDQNNKALNLALYAEDSFNITNDLSIVAGSRFQYAHRSVSDDFLSDTDSDPNDSASTDFYSATPKLGFVWNYSASAQIFGNASGGYEPPLLLELASPVVIGGGLDELNAQKSAQFEVGARGELWNRIAWDISLYNIELWDEIQNINVQPFPSAPFTIPRFQNIDRSRHSGVEAGLDVNLICGILSRIALQGADDTLSARLAYTYSRFVFVNDDNFGDNDLPGAPEHFIRAEIRYDNPIGFWIAPNLESTPKGYFVDSENTEKTDDYTLINLEFGYRYEPWNLGAFFEVSNILDRDYIASVVVDDASGSFISPGNGRSFYAGIEWGWK
ncbi:MAG: TonB-dependent receptor family protein [Deltaproteobacteria bacterium]